MQTRLLLRRLLQLAGDLSSSETLEAEIHKAISATLAHYVYGYEAEPHGDPLLLDLKEATKNFVAAALPSNFMVNLFPTLMHIPAWFPGAGWKRTAQQWREQKEHAIDAVHDWTKRQMATGECVSSMVSSLLNDSEHLGLDPEELDDYVKQLAVTMFVAGPDTIASTLVVFVLAMLLFPDIQKRAQQEIDAVIGLDRLPVMDDKTNLKYINRLIEEVLRWQPIAPLGGPHACSQDDVYQGYHIPKGTVVFANVWAMTRDTSTYSDPKRFEPDRYLDPNVPYAPAFGFGRRMCPGMHYAKASLFLTISSVLAVFDIALAKDSDGKDQIPELKSANQVP